MVSRKEDWVTVGILQKKGIKIFVGYGLVLKEKPLCRRLED